VKRALVLGAGLVSRPLVDALASRDGLALTVADLDAAKAERVLAGRGRALGLSLDDGAALAALAREADLIVSLLPPTLHVRAAQVALAQHVPLITTSYVSPEMRALDSEARRTGVLLLNEIGLDPGLDHMSAMRTIAAIRDEGGRVVSFRSCCGGLPAPESNSNPWGYKFSWSPRGVLAAGRNGARWLESGRVVDVPGEELFRHGAPYDVPDLGRLEVYPNRDATSYVATYGLDGVETMFRGTLRWPGWCETLDAVARAGLLDDGARSWPAGATYAQLMAALAAPGRGPIASRVAARAGVPADGAVMRRLAWTGLFSDRALPSRRIAPIDALCALMTETMSYGPSDRDMVVLRHEFGIEDARGRRSGIVSTLVAYGEPGGDSAMARTVSLPAAVTAGLVLEGRIAATGVRIPVDPEIYEPVLRELARAGIEFRDDRTAR
jgi:saccharopine dehydrogenase-like NADP-dependent oxidoreductase